MVTDYCGTQVWRCQPRCTFSAVILSRLLDGSCEWEGILPTEEAKIISLRMIQCTTLVAIAAVQTALWDYFARSRLLQPPPAAILGWQVTEFRSPTIVGQYSTSFSYTVETFMI